jgi:hypothetical protein
VDIEDACQKITHPPGPMALRLSSTLMAGVARVYQSQVSYYHTDVNQAYIKLRKSFMNTSENNINMTYSEAKRDAITLEARLQDTLLDLGADVEGPEVELKRLLLAAKAGNRQLDKREVQMGWLMDDFGTFPVFSADNVQKLLKSHSLEIVYITVIRMVHLYTQIRFLVLP